jgi:hypothetical protein
MSSLTSTEKMKLEKLLEMGSGYVLNFSNHSFQSFILENCNIDIYSDKYIYGSSSKANRLRAFWKVEENKLVGKLILHLLDTWKVQKELNHTNITLDEQNLFNECQRISQRLIQGKSPEDLISEQILNANNLDDQKKLSAQLATLLNEFDKLSLSSDFQKRGYDLQEILSQLFTIYEFQVTNSFQRNEGGEQIDGAFSYMGWYYLLECKWTKKMSNIRDLDSLFGKVGRGGRQTMGLFISVEGWSENITPLLKQNPDKCIILMDGYDLRTILCGFVSINELLDAKIAELNFNAEPFLSVKELLRSK